MSGLFHTHFLLCAVFLIGGPLSSVAAEADGWDLLARFLYRDAAEAFAKAAERERERDLGLAVALLNEPPVTSGKIARAGRLLSEVAAGGSDDTGCYARYLLARIMHVHRAAPVSEVEQAYRAIIGAAPDSIAAQLAAVQLALLLLYQRPDFDVNERITAAAALKLTAGNPRLPDTAATYFQQLAVVAMFYHVTDERVLGWLETAHGIGLSNPLDQSTLSLQIAETARALGERDTALAYYKSFMVAAVSTDQRYHTAETRMNELQTEGGP